MASLSLIRWGGLAGIVAGVMFVGSAISNLFASGGPVFTSFSDYLGEVLYIVALVGTLLMIAGLHALQRGRYGRLGAIDSLTAFVGFALMLLSAVTRTLAGGSLLVGHGAIAALGSLGWLAALIGVMSLGYVSQRAGVLPRWCGMLLSIGFPLSLVLGVALALTLDGAWISLALFLWGIIWALVGYALFRAGEHRSPEPSRVH